jgi:hypothetical protein
VLNNNSLTYIKNNQIIYRTVLKEAKRLQREKQVTTVINKPKKVWDIINIELGNNNFVKDNIEINNSLTLITIPQFIADTFNFHFIDIQK